MLTLMNTLIVEDHPVFCNALIDLLHDEYPDMQIRHIDRNDNLNMILSDFSPELALVDLELHQSLQMNTIQFLRDSFRALPILVVSMYSDARHVRQAMESGANGFVTKYDSPCEVIRGVKSVLEGTRYLSARASVALAESIQQSDEMSLMDDYKRQLSKREFETFSLLGRGLDRKAIASLMSIAVPTVESHIERIKNKLDIQSTHKLIRKAIHAQVLSSVTRS